MGVPGLGWRDIASLWGGCFGLDCTFQVEKEKLEVVVTLPQEYPALAGPEVQLLEKSQCRVQGVQGVPFRFT